MCSREQCPQHILRARGTICMLICSAAHHRRGLGANWLTGVYCLPNNTCAYCPRNSITNQTQSVTPSQCVGCGADMYAVSTGSTSCSACNGTTVLLSATPNTGPLAGQNSVTVVAA